MKKIRIRDLTQPGATEQVFATGQFFLAPVASVQGGGTHVEDVDPLVPGEVVMLEDGYADWLLTQRSQIVEETTEPHTRVFPASLEAPMAPAPVPAAPTGEVVPPAAPPAPVDPIPTPVPPAPVDPVNPEPPAPVDPIPTPVPPVEPVQPVPAAAPADMPVDPLQPVQSVQPVQPVDPVQPAPVDPAVQPAGTEGLPPGLNPVPPVA